MKKFVWVLIIIISFIAANVFAFDISKIDCKKNQIRVAFMTDLNKMFIDTHKKFMILDLSNPKSVLNSKSKVICHYDATCNDGTVSKVEISVTINSVGQPLIEISERE
jgi:hypothetical protein